MKLLDKLFYKKSSAKLKLYDDHMEMAIKCPNEVLEAIADIVEKSLDDLVEKKQEERAREMYSKYTQKKRETGE